MLKRASQVQLGLSTFNLLFYFTAIFKTTLALEAGPNKWSNRILPFTGFTGVRGVSSQATMPPPRHLGVGVAAVMRSSPQIKLARLSSLLPRLRATIAEQGPPRGAGIVLPTPFCAAEFDSLAREPAHQTNQHKNNSPLLRHACRVCRRRGRCDFVGGVLAP